MGWHGLAHTQHIFISYRVRNYHPTTLLLVNFITIIQQYIKRSYCAPCGGETVLKLIIRRFPRFPVTVCSYLSSCEVKSFPFLFGILFTLASPFWLLTAKTKNNLFSNKDMYKPLPLTNKIEWLLQQSRPGNQDLCCGYNFHAITDRDEISKLYLPRKTRRFQIVFWMAFLSSCLLLCDYPPPFPPT